MVERTGGVSGMALGGEGAVWDGWRGGVLIVFRRAYGLPAGDVPTWR